MIGARRLRALEGLLITLFGILLRRLTPELIKTVVDKILDVIEDAIDASETQTDDALLEPVIAAIRLAFDLPDDDEDNEPTIPMEPSP